MEARVCQMAGRWERGLKRAYACEFCDGEGYRITAAEFYHAYAAYLCGEGEVEQAKVYVGEAAKVFPPVRLPMSDVPALAPISGGVDLP